jgi:hypothetical protein
MRIDQIPLRWVLLRIPNNVLKVFAVWEGGYLNAFDWRINSGIKKTEQDQDYYYFYGFSGSVYKCKKTSYGIYNIEASMFLKKLIDSSKNQIELIEDINEIELP